MDAMINISVIMLLFVAGMEVQLPLVIEQGKVALSTTFFSMLIPIGVGYLGVQFLPELFMASTEEVGLVGFFIGVVLSITALPVIARILMDMNLFKTRIGMTIIASAMLIDLLGWLIFSVLLSVIEDGPSETSLTHTLISIVVFGGFMLTIGSRLIDKSLPWVQTKFSWPGGVLALSFGLCFLGAAFTESIGIHSILGAFIVGIAFGDSANMRDRTREIIHQFVTNVFAPIFFVSIGLYVNFVDNFNLPLIGFLLVLAYSSKIIGAKIGARLGGLSKRDSWAVGVSMNTHGVLEIILGSLAMVAGLINEEVFVAIVVLVVISIITSAPMLKRIMNK
jgi:Kef-type K+ transport system membrane component KefB